ncbi:MAG: hypothetical protein WCG26_12920 [Chloroflexales bacterium]
MTRAYVRRKRFEGQILACEIVGLLSEAFGGEAAAAPERSATGTMAPSALLQTMGIAME